MIIYQTKGERLFLVSDSAGYFYTFRRDGTFRSRFYSGFSEIRSIIKHYVNVLFTSGNKIGFVKVAESAVGGSFCDAGPYEILTATLDTMTTSLIYAATTTGEILVFESFNTALKPESLECKLLGKAST